MSGSRSLLGRTVLTFALALTLAAGFGLSGAGASSAAAASLPPVAPVTRSLSAAVSTNVPVRVAVNALPRIVRSNPANNATNVARSIKIKLTFSGLAHGQVWMRDATTGLCVDFRVSINMSNLTATVTPQGKLIANHVYQIAFVQSASVEPYFLTFETGTR